MEHKKLEDRVVKLRDSLEVIRNHVVRDGLTGLYNRAGIEAYFKNAGLAGKDGAALAFFHIENFRSINDTLGHAVGDLVLQEAAVRLGTHATDNGVVAARLGGSEFVMLFPTQEREEVVAATERVLRMLLKPMSIQSYDLQPIVNAGVALYPSQAATFDELLQNANLALYAARDAQSNTVKVYSPEMALKLQVRLSVEQGLKTAIRDGELELFYMPFVELEGGKVVGVEALLRWNKNGRVISPLDFIPTAEAMGLIIPIGHWVLERALHQVAEWKQQGVDIRVAVNLSSKQFYDSKLVEHVENAIKASGLPPHTLELEITESAAMENVEDNVAKLIELKRIGVTIALDDFGTGYSSLGYLKRLPIDKLKIDQGFIRNILQDNHDKAITQAIVAMGHALGIIVCAEGVETAEHEALLKGMECDLAQGYYISKPISASAMTEWLKAYK